MLDNRLVLANVQHVINLLPRIVQCRDYAEVASRAQDMACVGLVVTDPTSVQQLQRIDYDGEVFDLFTSNHDMASKLASIAPVWGLGGQTPVAFQLPPEE